MNKLDPKDEPQPDPTNGMPVAGPRRRAPTHYAGETFGRKKARTTYGAPVRVPRAIQYPDVERHANGAVPGKRNKFMRRLIRKALKRQFSSVEKALKLPRAMLEQARLIAKEEKKSSRFARRLYKAELAIHQAVYVPTKKELRAQRTEKRKLKRKREQDAISKLVERMAGP